MPKQVNHRRFSQPVKSAPNRTGSIRAADATALAALLAVLGLWGAWPAGMEAKASSDDPTTSPTPTPTPSPTPTPTPTPSPTPPAIPTVPASPILVGTPVVPVVPVTSPLPTASPAETKAGDVKPKAPVSNGEKILGKFGKDINISGGMSLSSQQSDISGGSLAQETYNQQNGQLYDTRRIGPFSQSMDLTIQGKVFNVFSVNARLTNSRYGNYANQRFGFNYKSGGTAINLGDVNATLGGNELVTFSRSLQGLMFSRDFGAGRVKMTGIASLTRALTRRGTFQGNGTTGPYYLNGSNILEGTEKLRLNGTDLAAGTDYRIDYMVGQVTFSAGRIINASDTVEFTYESQNYNTTPGLLTGTRWDLGFGKGGTVGVTYIQQKSLQGISGDGTQTYRFPVQEDPTFKYQLTPAVATGSVVVIKWYERTLVEGADYVLNRPLNLFILRNPLPPDTSVTGNASLSVSYKASQVSGVGGNRSVMGLDMALPVGTLGNVAVQFGQSNGALDSQSGQAMTIRANFKSQGNSHKNAWTLSTGWRNVGTGFSTIDSTAGAFLNAEKGLQSTLSFSPNDFVQITTSLINSKLATTNYTNAANPTTGTLSWTSNQNINTDIALTYPHLPSLRLTHGIINQSSGLNGTSKSTFTNDQVSLSWQKGILGITGALGRTAANGRTVFGNYSSTIGATNVNGTIVIDTTGTSTSSTNNSSSDTSRLQISLSPAAWISLSGNLGFSRNHFGTSADTTGSGSLSSARDTGLVVNLIPRSNLALTASITNSTNGQSTSNFFNNTTLATGTGITIPGASTLSGQRTSATTYTFQYTPFERLSLNGNLSRSLSLVPGYDNTESKSSDMGFNFAMFSRLQIGGQLSNQRLTYVGGQGNSNNQSYTMTGTAGPFGKFSFTSTLQRMNFGSAIYNYGTTSTSTGIKPLTGLGTVLGSGTGITSGYLQQGLNTIWSLRTDYAIGGNRSLFLQWQSLDAAAPQNGIINSTSTTDSLGYHTAQNYKRGTGTVGLEIRLTDIIAFTLDTNLITLRDRDDQKYSYRARAVNMDLSARF